MSKHSEIVAEFSEKIGRLKGEYEYWDVEVPRALRLASKEPENVDIVHKDFLEFADIIKKSCQARIEILKEGIAGANKIQEEHEAFMKNFNEESRKIREG
jgi:hypothetical protein